MREEPMQKSESRLSLIPHSLKHSVQSLETKNPGIRVKLLQVQILTVIFGCNDKGCLFRINCHGNYGTTS